MLCSLLRTFVLTMEPLISFIVAYHNEPKAMLEACVDCILALPLSRDEAEVIVVDDGSKAPCALHDARCMVYRQEHAGLSVARNTGIGHARGKYIQFIDADDCIIPLAYEAVLEQLRKEDSDIVMFKMTMSESDNSKASSAKGSRVGTGAGAFFLLHRNLRAAAWGYAFRRDILGELRFHPGLLHEDELFTPQLFLKAESLCELDVKAYFYRQHQGTITHSKSPESVQRRLGDIHFTIRELQSFDNPILERRIRQLTVDYLQKTWMLTHSFSELRCRMRQLRREGLLPLPLRFYSPRYLLVALLARLC